MGKEPPRLSPTTTHHHVVQTASRTRMVNLSVRAPPRTASDKSIRRTVRCLISNAHSGAYDGERADPPRCNESARAAPRIAVSFVYARINGIVRQRLSRSDRRFTHLLWERGPLYTPTHRPAACIAKPKVDPRQPAF